MIRNCTTLYSAAVCCSSAQQDCSETHTITRNQFFRVPPGTVCFQCDFGSGVATDSTFQLDNLPVGWDMGTVQNGVLTIFAAENVFDATDLTTLSCTSGSTRITAPIFLKSKCFFFYFFEVSLSLCVIIMPKVLNHLKYQGQCLSERERH